MQEIQEASPEEIDESLIKLSEETDNTIGENKIVSMLDNMTLKDSVKSFDEQIQTLNTEIQGRREDSSNIDNIAKMSWAMCFLDNSCSSTTISGVLTSNGVTGGTINRITNGTTGGY